MRKALMVLAMLTLAALAANAQEAPRLLVDIPFQFVAGETTLPAGSYELQVMASGAELSIRNLQTKQEVMVPSYTRLSERSNERSEVVFDVSGGNHFLSEVHVVGIDGFAFKGFSGRHTHLAVPAKK